MAGPASRSRGTSPGDAPGGGPGGVPGTVQVPELSLVVVHGIGSQAAGQTARTWAESAVSFLARSGTPARITDVVPSGIGRPPVFAVEVHAPGPVQAPPVVRLRFVDAFWADAFPAPGVAQVVRWMFVIGPHLAVAQAVLSARRRATTARRSRFTGGLASMPARWGASARVLPVLFALASVALLAPLVALIALVLAVVTLVPIPAVRRVVVGTLGFLSFGIGDVTTVLRDPTSLKAIRARVRWALVGELERVGDPARVHVVAHSQGGAIAHAVIAGLAPGSRPARLTTVGAATGRLNDLSHLDPLPRWSGPAAASSALAALAILPLVGVSGLLVLGPVAWICAVGWWQWRYWSRRYADPAAIPQLDGLRGVDWLDMWAPFDLVPNGRPVSEGQPGYRVTFVPGAMSLSDHVRYAGDLAETIPRVLAHVAGALPQIRELALRPAALAPGGAQLGAHRGLRSRSALRDPTGGGANWMPWEGRDWLSFGMRVASVLGAVVLAMVAGTGVLGEWGRWARQWGLVDAAAQALERWLTWATGLLTDGRTACCSDTSPAVGAAVVVGAALVLGLVAARAVAAVQRRSLATWLGSGLVERSVTQVSWALVGILAGWCALVTAAVVLLLGGPPGT